MFHLRKYQDRTFSPQKLLAIESLFRSIIIINYIDFRVFNVLYILNHQSILNII